MRTARLFCAVIPLLALTPFAAADVIWNDAVDGDLSNDRLAPTAFSFGAGTHSVIITTGTGDIDYVSITIPEGTEFTELVLNSYTGRDGIAFGAIDDGPVFGMSPNDPPFDILGWTHFGPGMENVGTNILDDMGWGSGAIGFEGPLPAGTYSFWFQQLAPAVTFQMDFVIVPAPGIAGMVAAATLVGLRRRRAAV